MHETKTKAAANSWDALAEVAFWLRRCKSGVEGAPQRLRHWLDEHARRVDAAYGRDSAIYVPKWHFRLHVPSQASQDGFLLDTFAGERFNYMMKQACDPIRNTTCFERSALARAYLLHKNALHRLQSDGLVEPIETAGPHRISARLRWLGVLIEEGCLFFQDDLLFECVGTRTHSWVGNLVRRTAMATGRPHFRSLV